MELLNVQDMTNPVCLPSLYTESGTELKYCRPDLPGLLIVSDMFIFSSFPVCEDLT